MAKQWSASDLLKTYGPIVAKKMGFIALGWVAVYFISQPFRGSGIPILFSPVIGAVAGLVAGWYMATDSVEDSGLYGLPLRAIIVIAAAAPMWGVEGILHLIMPGREFGFGGWMLVSSATLMAMAAGAWHESSQE